MINITFTGVDVKTSIPDLIKLQSEFPKILIEWGILLSQTRSDNRYPSLGKIEDILLEYSKTVRFAVHLCGSTVPEFAEWYTNQKHYLTTPTVVRLVKKAQRAQLNFNFERYKESLDELMALSHSQFHLIAQFNKSNQGFWKDLNSMATAFAPLVDASGGRGKVIQNFNSPPGYLYVGYAGGITPDNCKDILESARQVTQGRSSFWLDMESGVRNSDDWLDLGLVQKVLEKLHDA